MNGNIIIFEDDHVDQMQPMSLTRPVFSLTCGGWTLHEMACLAHCQVRHIVRDHVRPVSKRDYPDSTRGEGTTLFLNASLVPDVEHVRSIRELLLEDCGKMYFAGDRLAAAILPADRPVPTDLTADNVAQRLQKRNLPRATDIDFATIDVPHQLVRLNRELFPSNIRRRIVQSDYPERREGVFAAPSADIADSAVFNTTNGPVLIDEGTKVMDFVYVEGPAYIGPGSILCERSSLKECVSIGHTCKIGGEVEVSVVEPYSNKQHHGYLGHAWIGSWVNIGAGTTNDNIDASYGPISVEHKGGPLNSGMQFFGCLMGDLSRTAVNTSIAAGTVVGVGSRIAGYVEGHVPGFCEYAPALNRAREVAIEDAAETQQSMFTRRDVEPTCADTDLLQNVHEMTNQERSAFLKSPAD